MHVADAFSIGRAINHGWAAFKRQPVGLLIGSVCLSMTEGGGGGGGGGNWGGTSSGSSTGTPTTPGTPGTPSGHLHAGLDILGQWLHQAGLPSLDQLHGSMSDTLAGPAGVALVGLAVVLGSCCIGVVWLFRSYIQGGYIQLQRDLIVEGQGNAGTVFSGGSTFTRIAGWKALRMLITIGVASIAAVPAACIGLGGHFLMHWSTEGLIGATAATALLTWLPAIAYVGLGLMFGEHAIVIDRSGPMDALERSWSLARGNRIHLLIYFFVTNLFVFLGLFACCVGIFVTRAVVDAGTTEAYLLATQPGADAYAMPSELGLF